MRPIFVAAVVGLVGCANGGVDGTAVVQGLTQDQVDQTVWLFNAQTRDLVAAADLAGPQDGFEAVAPKLVGPNVVICDAEGAGVRIDVLRGGEVRPDPNPDVVTPGDDDGAASGGAADGVFGAGEFNPAHTPETAIDVSQFDKDMFSAMREFMTFIVFDLNCP